ncbi:RNA-binding S4 domain-containing protein [Thalassoroseus pseudoceratinae]|uniref:RNA-binding S4 domain-containing protein n=1 Tax=Thalassoroseus pseudoceratinae TaxID=2713176 RepID=UPI00142269EA|nr:RNA-binding S4 domain-containing protein [Thalassoroseus pseudoceratinae]
MSEETPAETIRLDQFLKLAGIVGTGGQAKLLIQDGQVMVNGEIETRRRRQLRPGDIMEFDGEEFHVVSDDDDEVEV